MAPVSVSSPRCGPDAALLLFALALAGCDHARSTSCTVEVTAGSGTFRGVAAGARPRADLERDALHDACAQLCAGEPGGEGCAARCAVDAQAGKIGARKVCKEGSSR